MDATAQRPADPRFLKGAVQFGDRPYANTAVLVEYLAKRVRVVLGGDASRNEVEGQLRQWLHPNDLNNDRLPWDIPTLAEAVRKEM